ncbi:hypothetical protein [Occallatibacter savannae]|uniref:hypothetical protein n=1 Tax=Occallatibacter savannae TaxID=1002691 RepID=UPI000D69B762|nr:hypothetical protein [Occallatibacter savannae]
MKMNAKEIVGNTAEFLRVAEEKLHNSGLTPQQVDAIEAYVSLAIDARLAGLSERFEAAFRNNILAPVFPEEERS